MSHIEIEWLTDYHNCETCGSSYAAGARVKIDGAVAIECLPVAHCFGGDHYETSDVYAAVLKHFGHTVDDEYCRDIPPKEDPSVVLEGHET